MAVGDGREVVQVDVAAPRFLDHALGLAQRLILGFELELMNLKLVDQGAGVWRWRRHRYQRPARFFRRL